MWACSELNKDQGQKILNGNFIEKLKIGQRFKDNPDRSFLLCSVP